MLDAVGMALLLGWDRAVDPGRCAPNPAMGTRRCNMGTGWPAIPTRRSLDCAMPPERQIWPQPADWHPTRAHLPQPADWHPTRAHLPPPSEPVPVYVLTAQPEIECVRLESEQHTAIRAGLLKLEDAPMMACECDDCWRLFDATEVDGGEL